VLLDAPELIVQKVSGGRHDLIPTDYIKTINEIYGVGNVIPRYWGYYFDLSTDGNYTLMGVNKNIKNLKLLDGRMPAEHGECVIGKGISDITGDYGMMYLIDSNRRTRIFDIVGEFTADSELLTNDLILLTEEDIKSLFSISPGRATDLVVQVHNESEIPFVASKVRNFLPDTRPIMKSEIIQTYETLFSWRSGMILTMLAGALIAFCILAWDKATGLSADERREIGILKAIGWDTSDILELKFWEGAVLSFTSFLAGMILAYVHIFFLGALFFAPVLKGWSVLFPQFRLMPYINLYQVFAVFFLTVIPYVASTIIPSWKAAITDPDVVMRG
jgi:ABC-type lipoprotein release transport system permease subunit